MLNNNDSVIKELLKNNEEFKKLFEEHIRLEQDLEALYSLKYFPPEVEIKIKEIKLTKLKGKDRMNQIIKEYKKEKGVS
ncbi:conserved hypothetical protein [Deferribacter desulfuricans SSM1]|uniref:DUF465 domain-containing protein n=1 Tax=Deferribacter desulfuricans (strain DSM 14783 / JCM 11476 / NBRC 101012 / SSM1) TaxID=639282 RepID=D3PEF3_DEFDS|nr:hypothetical protein [Deferribacter desulfuricans]BAI80976.1 conserved hypothetical protein [Deferribacter desulfuricans SSM1]